MNQVDRMKIVVGVACFNVGINMGSGECLQFRWCAIKICKTKLWGGFSHQGISSAVCQSVLKFSSASVPVESSVCRFIDRTLLDE
jgi:hypothetical protein